MKTGTFTLALLAALGMFVASPAASAAEEYTVVVKKVEVKSTKSDGADWDINMGKPDLAVSVRNMDEKDSKAWRTKTKDDVFSADFDETSTVRVRPGQRVEIEVLDVDAALNDSVGKATKELDATALKTGKLKLEKFGQVIMLEIEFKKS